MYLDRISSAGPDTDLIAPAGVSALLWEAALADVRGHTAQSAWPSERIQGFGHWLRERWETAQATHTHLRERTLLSPGQTQRLWQRVIDDSTEGASLIGTASVAGWAHEATRSLYEFDVSVQEIAASEWPSDRSTFRTWHQRYEAALNENGWINADQLLYTLNRLPDAGPVRDLLLLDPPAPTPELARLRSRWLDRGARIDSVRPDDCRANVRALITATAETEIGLLLARAAWLFEQQPGARLAVVVPDLALCRNELEVVFNRDMPDIPLLFPRGLPIGETGLFGGAMSALQTVTPGANFDALSRWLRSPYFCAGNPEYRHKAARFERRLRHDPRLQQDFPSGYKRFGLRDEFRRHLPEASECLDIVFDRLPRRATPTAWAQVWQNCLRTLGWDGFDADPGDALRSSWDNAWGHFAELTPITGPLSAAAALSEFERQLDRELSFERAHLGGIHVLDNIRDVGPGYAAVWVTGFSDRAWPERPRSSPLLPRAIRQRLRMPGTDPVADLALANVELEHLFARVPEATFSCPMRVLDQPQVSNPRFTDWAEAGGFKARATAGPGTQLPARTEELVDDPPPPLATDYIPGGVRTLDLQSACPVRAFAITRLGAEPLVPAVRGIDPKLRGTVLHRALELLFAHDTMEHRREQCSDCVTQAFTQLVPMADQSWNTQVAAERSRMVRLLEGLLDLDCAREPFSIVAREQAVEIVMADKHLRCRVDRIDKLGGGERILLDYKTGRLRTGNWFGERLGNVQLPLYAMAPGPVAAAVALVVLNGQGVEYKAVGQSADSLPGRQKSLASDAWAAQLARWREQLTELVNEFSAGDVRIRREATELADGPFAALTRIKDFLR